MMDGSENTNASMISKYAGIFFAKCSVQSSTRHSIEVEEGMRH